jgi:hypothetical protein
MQKYLMACKEDVRKASSLYKANIRLSQKLYVVIGIFEITLRNCIDNHFLRSKGPEWLANSVAEMHGYLNYPGCEKSYHSVQEGIHQLNINYTHNCLLTSMSFGFWTHQFSRKEYAASGNTLLDIFINRPKGINQKVTLDNLRKINILRNRIAHYEPICFNEFGFISTAMTIKRYTLIKDLLHWLGYNPRHLFYGLDGVQKEIDFINRL